MIGFSEDGSWLSLGVASRKAARAAAPSAAADASVASPVQGFDTPVDLGGRLSPERMIVDQERLLVIAADGSAAIRRQWRWEQTGDFRLEPCVGSCFLQAHVDGAWVDVLRYPGVPDDSLRQWADRLNARCRWQREFTEKDSSAGDGESTWSRRFSVPSRRGEAPHRLHVARRLLSVVRPFSGSMLLLLALSFGVVAIDVAPPMLQRMLVDNVLQTDPGPAGRMRPLLLLLLAIVAGLLLVRVATAVTGIWKSFVSSRIGAALTSNLRDALVEKLNELPLAFHDRNQVGLLMSRVAYDTETLHTLVYHLTGGLLMQALQLLGISVMLFYLNFKLALITMLPMPAIIAGSWYFTRYLNPRHNHYWEAVGRQAAALSGMLSGIRVVKAFVQEEREVARFRRFSARLRDARQKVDVSTGAFAAVMGFVFALGVLAVWYLGGRDVLFAHMSLGSLMAFLAYLAMFYTPLTSIAESTTWFSTFFTASRRIFEILDVPGETADQAAAGLPRVQGHVEFQDVTFGYDKNRPVLRDVSFAIRPGEMVGVVGRSGSGKSTLVSLIGRLYEIDAGRILIDGHDLRPLDRCQLRRAIGMVPQDPFLFRGTVADNIAYGNVDAAPEQILRAARYADAHNFILRMPLAYESQLGDSGLGLSGGERQRLSIARALLFDPAILILDEATASVDAESERAICNALRRFARSRTTIVIAHRLSTLQDADRLLVFDQGRLIEQGTHDELLDRGGLYSTLVHLQRQLREGHRSGESRVHVSGNGEHGHGACGNGSSGNGVFHGGFPLEPAPGVGCARDGSHAGDDCPEGDPELHWLDPSAATLVRDWHGRLRLSYADGRTYGDVSAVRAFPASHERRFISLRTRDAAGREIEVGLIDSLDHWPSAAQEAVEQSLSRRYLLRPVREICQVRTGGDALTFNVLTDAGPARFELRRPGEGFQSFGKNGLLLVDSQGSYYVIPNRSRLPKQQQQLLKLYFCD